LPAAVTVFGDYAVIGELRGQVTILDKAGAVVTRLGTNTEPGVGGNQLKPDQWRPGFVVSRTAWRSTSGATFRLRVQRLRTRSSVQQTVSTGESRPLLPTIRVAARPCR
jgi:hypothetical protein